MINEPHAQLRAQPGLTPQLPSTPTWPSLRHAALDWFHFGADVAPIRPGTKATARKWDPWLDGLSPSKITNHWRQHPTDEVGFIVGDTAIVFDADCPEALAALKAAEACSGVTPLLVVQTKRGEHHFFARDPGSPARPRRCHLPKGLDVQTGRALVVLPPSTGKTIVKMEVSRASDLSVATQAFIDALTGGPHHAPAPTVSRLPPEVPEVTEPTLRLLQAILNHLDPDLPYDDWFAVAAALFHTSGGCEDAYLLFDSWSADGRKYKHQRETSALWKSLRLDHPRPRTIGTLRYMLQEDGISWDEIVDAAVEAFDVVDDGSDQ